VIKRGHADKNRGLAKAGLESHAMGKGKVGKRLEKAIKAVSQSLDALEAAVAPLIGARLYKRKPLKDGQFRNSITSAGAAPHRRARSRRPRVTKEQVGAFGSSASCPIVSTRVGQVIEALAPTFPPAAPGCPGLTSPE